MSALIISNTSVRRDTAGRYSLNDLHRAAGGENKHRPSLWVDNQQTRQLINELQSEAGIPALVSAHGGAAPGTYVIEELVIAYAAWISAEFHVQVLRTFLNSKKAPESIALPDFTDPAAAARAWADEFSARRRIQEEAKALVQAVEESRPKVEFHDAVASAINCQTVEEVAKVLGTGRSRLYRFLRDEGMLMTGNRPYQRFLDAGHFRLVEKRRQDHRGEWVTYTQTLISGKGLTYIQRRIADQGRMLKLAS